MAVDERRRSQLYEQLAGVVGEEAAVTMFELLPPPSTNLATSADLERMDARFAQVDARFDQLEERFDLKLDALRDELVAVFRGELVTAVAGQTRAMLVAVVTTVAAVGGLALALAQLLT